MIISQLGDDIDGAAAEDESGESVSLSADGNRVAIGKGWNEDGAGVVRVYDWDGAAWVQAGADIDGEALGDCFGCSVSMSADGNRVAVGAPVASTIGARAGVVRVYDWDGAGWVQAGADIDGEAAGDYFGHSVSMSADGNRVAIGTDDEDKRGYVRVYDWDGSAWVQAGANINGEISTGEGAGRTVSISADGNRVAIGDPYNDREAAGHVQVYDWDGAGWVQAGADIDGEADGDKFGWSVSMSADGNRVAIGALQSGELMGHVGMYDWDGAAWVQAGADIDGEADGDESGKSVSLSADANRVAIGARGNDGNGQSAGHVRIYDWVSSAWVQAGTDIDGEAAGDTFGHSVSLSADGNRVAIGAPGNDGNGEWSGHVRVYALVATAPSTTSTTVAAAPTTAAPRGTLPETGSKVNGALLLATAFFASGLALGAAARRRTP